LNIDRYRHLSNGRLSFSRQQASRFAKEEAGDFNPLHDVDSRRFCVPGDLLFVTLLEHYGIAIDTRVEFSSMVDDSKEFELPEQVGKELDLCDTGGKSCLQLSFEGDRITDSDMVTAVCSRYVAFSGKTFPDILVGLMNEHGVMINPTRPLVIYKSMQVKLQPTEVVALSQEQIAALTLELDNTAMVIDGKKATATLEFRLETEGQLIGRGNKIMVLGGLRDYDQAVIDDIVGQYNTWKSDYRPDAVSVS